MSAISKRVGAVRARLSGWLKPEHAYPSMPDTFEPTEPSYDVALTAYQTLLELSRRHPTDTDMMVHAQSGKAGTATG